MKSLALVGLPGAGKSTVARGVADRLGWALVDFDEEIERRAGMTVAEIFARQGEADFRAREMALTRELAGRAGLVLSPGGGWVTNPGAMALLRPVASIVYLEVSPETALARLGAARSARPLLERPDPLAALGELLARRRLRYDEADHRIAADLLTVQEVIERVVRLARTGGAG